MAQAAPAFDAYHKWLGIPPAEQPPHHYRLLGIATFEADADVIEAAAEQRMAHVRARQTGPQSALSQKLLNEISAATRVLLVAEARQRYDEELRRKMTTTAPIESSQPLAAPDPLAIADAGFAPLTVSPLRPARRIPARTKIPIPVLAAGIAALTMILVVVVVVLAQRGNRSSIATNQSPSNPPMPRPAAPSIPPPLPPDPPAAPTDLQTTPPAEPSASSVTPSAPSEANAEAVSPENEAPPAPEVTVVIEQESPTPEPPKVDPNAPLLMLTGTWTVTYDNGAIRIYDFNGAGKVKLVNLENLPGRLLVEENGDVVLDFRDGKIERLRLVDGVLLVEHFNPASLYPDSPALAGRGELTP